MNCRHPNNLAYKLLQFNSLLSRFGANLIFGSIGMAMGFASNISSLQRRFSIYFCWEMEIELSVCVTLMPTILCGSPRLVTSYSELRTSFMWSIIWSIDANRSESLTQIVRIPCPVKYKHMDLMLNVDIHDPWVSHQVHCSIHVQLALIHIMAWPAYKLSLFHFHTLQVVTCR